VIKRKISKGIVVTAVLMLTACGSGVTKKELVEDIRILNEDTAWLEATLLETEQSRDVALSELKKIQGVLMEPDRVRISELIDGTGRTSFMLGEDGELFFPKELFLEGVTAIPNTTRIILGDDVSIVPAGNWVTNIQGTTVHYSHSNGVRGVTRIGSSETNADYETMVGSLEHFFEDFPTATIVYSDIFISGTLRGIQARATTFVEEEPHVVHAFVISSHRVTVLGAFDFVQSNIREEIATQLISSLAWSGIRIHIES
jgi:hypothetical protein